MVSFAISFSKTIILTLFLSARILFQPNLKFLKEMKGKKLCESQKLIQFEQQQIKAAIFGQKLSRIAIV